MKPRCFQFPHLPPEDTAHGTPSGTCPGGDLGISPSGSFSSKQHDAGRADRGGRALAWLRPPDDRLEFIGDAIGALSLFATLFVLLFFAGVFS